MIEEFSNPGLLLQHRKGRAVGGVMRTTVGPFGGPEFVT